MEYLVQVGTIFYRKNIVLWHSFLDIDECKRENDCDENGNCANTDGSYICSCQQGFMKNGTTCLGIDYTCMVYSTQENTKPLFFESCDLNPQM